MKIEKINSNQIKCVLNKSDLTSRQIKVSELAYGTDKAQELFKDMMSQANDEFGFEANDVPLMIEAVPLSADSIMLIITKVDNPDDIEDKFSNLPVPSTRTFKKKEQTETEVELEPNADKNEVKDELVDVFYVYTFDNMDDISKATAKINDFTFSKSSLFKDLEQSSYYLAIVADNIPRWANRIIRGTLSEYGESIIYRHSALSYFEEHFDTIVKDNAVNIMSQL
jgi:adapter protein MecA 1/2